MAFDVDELTRFATDAIRDFSTEHKNEIFYAFAIDASLLCFNSVQCFEQTLGEYQAKYPESYSADKNIEELRMNTGDWEYQGFADFRESEGFDEELYDEHYNLGLDLEAGDVALKATEYATTMDQVVKRLQTNGAFKSMNCAKDFQAIWVDHNY